MQLTLLCLPTWTLLDFIALLLSCYKAMYTAQVLYITGIHLMQDITVYYLDSIMK